MQNARTAPSSPEALGVVPTAPPATRLSARTVLDEATRPQAHRGPTPASTAAEWGSAQHLVDVHDHLRAELDTVRDLVEQVLRGVRDAAAARSAINVMTMRQQSWALGAYCQSYCRLVTGHHSLEDVAMLPHLRSADPGLGPVVDRLEAEHHAIHEVLEELDRALVRYVGDLREATGLQEAVDLLTDTLLSHLSYEEHELLAPLARHGYGFG